MTGLVLLLALQACGGSTTPASESTAPLATSTEVLTTPTASATPTPSATPEPAATEAPATEEPTAVQAAPPTPVPPPPAPTATSAPAATGPTVTVVASNLTFSTTTISATAGSQLTVVLDNQDAGVAHNLTLRGFGLDDGETCTGPCKTSVTFTVPAAGTYKFLCTVHPSMTGTLVVQ